MTGEKWSNLPHQPSTIENYRPKFHVVIAVKWDIRVLWKENQRWSRNVSDATLGTGTRVSIPSPRARPVAHKVTGKNRGWLPGLQMVYADKMKKKRREWRAEIERAEVNRSIEKKDVLGYFFASLLDAFLRTSPRHYSHPCANKFPIDPPCCL